MMELDFKQVGEWISRAVASQLTDFLDIAVVLRGDHAPVKRQINKQL